MSRFLTFLAVLYLPLAPAIAQGRFVGPVEAAWSTDHRTMKLTKPFEYIDAKKVSWFVPTGTIVDGASIPKVFWSIIGSPFVGPHRDASVVHDHFCAIRTRPWQQVHRVFYDAMLDAGVNPTKAWLMYKAVERFGPRWKERQLPPGCESPRTEDDILRCAENSQLPELEMPPLTRDELLKFIDEVEGHAAKKDLEELRAASSALTTR